MADIENKRSASEILEDHDNMNPQDMPNPQDREHSSDYGTGLNNT